MARVQYPCVEVRQSTHSFVLTKIPAGVLAKISYAAVRNQSPEPGAVQRLLSKTRVDRIKDFTLKGGAYPGAIILNWVGDGSNRLITTSSPPAVSFHDNPESAQIVDGQHRVGGIREAIAENSSIASMEMPVVLYDGLRTAECAEIFLAINTEQRPVPKSLVYDLFGEQLNLSIDNATLRARDIAESLHRLETSPYYELIRFPAAGTRGGITLASAVTAFKPLVARYGAFEQIGATALETQKSIVLNYFTALQRLYGDSWWAATNVFMKAAGFAAAVDFLQARILQYGHSQKSLKVEVVEQVMSSLRELPITSEEIRGQSAALAKGLIFDRLSGAFRPNTTSAPLSV